MTEKETPTTTPADAGTKLPIDISTKPDASGNVNITKAATEVRSEQKEASPPVAEAKKEEPKVDDKTKETEVAPPPETISKEEHQRIIDTIKGGHKGTADKLKQDIAQLKQAQIDAQVRAEEADTANWLRRVEEDGGDVKVAQRVAERDTASRKLERELAGKQAEIDSKLAILNEAGLKKTAYDLVTTYKLGEDTLEELLKSENPIEMENKALKLAREQVGAEARPKESTDKAVASTKGVDISKLSDVQRAGLAMEGEI